MLGEFLAADVESIEGIGAIGAVFEQVFFGLGEFLLQSSCSELKVHRLLSCGYRVALSESKGQRRNSVAGLSEDDRQTVHEEWQI